MPIILWLFGPERLLNDGWEGVERTGHAVAEATMTPADHAADAVPPLRQPEEA